MAEEDIFNPEWVKETRNDIAIMAPKLIQRIEQIAMGQAEGGEIDIAAAELLLSKVLPTVSDEHHSSVLQKVLNRVYGEEDR